MYDADLQCPECGTKFKKKLGNLSSGHSHECRKCGTTIQYSGNGGKKAEQALKKFERGIKRMFK